MGNCPAAEKGEVTVEDVRSNAIDEDFEKAEAEDRSKKKIILLGAGESGKSTLFKEMINLFTEGMTELERQQYVDPIKVNILEALEAICDASEKFMKTEVIKYRQLTDEEQSIRDAIAEINTDVDNNEIPNLQKVMTATFADDTLKLWDAESIKETRLNHRSKFQYFDSIDYYVEHIKRILSDGYLPTDQDILRCRIRTTGSVDLDFSMGDIKFKMTDVGGQRNERAKWINFFDGMDAVLFVAAISEYDQVMWEDEKTNRMQDCLELFEETVNLETFDGTDIILFLNKFDLFEDKLDKVPITVFFKDYQGDPHDLEDVVEYMSQYFKSLIDAELDHVHNVYVHTIVAVDPENVKTVFNDVKDMITEGTLGGGGLVLA
eukprot:183489_1